MDLDYFSISAQSGCQIAGPILYFSAIGAFLGSGVVGLLGAGALTPESGSLAASFVTLRPLHSFLALYALLSGVLGMFEAVLGQLDEIKVVSIVPRLQAFIFGGFGIAATVGISLGWMSGREYLSWDPRFTPLLAFVFVLAGWRAWRFRRALTVAPEGFWLLGLGLFFCFAGLIEGHLYLWTAVGGDVVRNLSVQWHGLDTLIAGINAAVFGGIISLTSMRRRPLRRVWLYAIAAFGLLFTFSHHHYLSPQPSPLKWLALAASLIAAVSFFRHGYALLAGGFGRKLIQNPVSYLFVSAEIWNLVAVGSGVLFAVPQVNRIVHGTHLVVVHAMGSMIGVDIVLIVLAGFIVQGGVSQSRARMVRGGMHAVNAGLFGLWIVLGSAGWIKGTLRLTEPYQVYTEVIRPWLYGFPVFGLLLLVGLAVLGFQLLRVLVGPRVEIETEQESEEPKPDTGRYKISGESAKGGNGWTK